MTDNLNVVLELDRLGVEVISSRGQWLTMQGPVRSLLIAVFSWVAEQLRSRLERLGVQRSSAKGVVNIQAFTASTEIVLARGIIDRSKAGDAAADKLAAAVSVQGVEVFRVLWPSGMDANDYARSVEQPGDAIQQAVRAARRKH